MHEPDAGEERIGLVGLDLLARREVEVFRLPLAEVVMHAVAV